MTSMTPVKMNTNWNLKWIELFNVFCNINWLAGSRRETFHS